MCVSPYLFTYLPAIYLFIHSFTSFSVDCEKLCFMGLLIICLFWLVGWLVSWF